MSSTEDSTITVDGDCDLSPVHLPIVSSHEHIPFSEPAQISSWLGKHFSILASFILLVTLLVKLNFNLLSIFECFVAVLLSLILLLKSWGYAYYLTGYSYRINSPLPSVPPTSLRVLSYNFWLRPHGIYDESGDWKGERLDDLIPLLNNYDVLCLQETFVTLNLRLPRLLAAARANGFDYVIGRPVHFLSSKVVDSGLMIMSRFPIREFDFVEFSTGIYIDRIVEKGALYAKVELRPDLHVHVFNTHVQSDYTDHLEQPVETVKADQVRTLAQFIERKCASNPSPVIVAGDFNIDFKESLNSVPDHAPHFDLLINHPHPYCGVLRDLLADSSRRAGCQHRPPTISSTYEIETGNEIDTHVRSEEVMKQKGWQRLWRSIDYILFAPGNAAPTCNVQLSETHKWRLFPESTVVEKFHIRNRPYVSLSDHYAVVTQFVIR